MNMMAIRILAAVALATVAVATQVEAQTSRGGNYPVQEMNFDLWCQEEAGLPPERCDKRTDQDEATFEAYRAKVEAYEIPYLQQKSNAARLDADILRNDPVDRPITQLPPQNRPDIDAPSTTTPPRP
ncbi:MAG TPA: hypothetical protein VHC39_14760 [Rhizomicrobium sp.]|nr:hypothetical protein [Rhizomicrobium sp.]